MNERDKILLNKVNNLQNIEPAKGELPKDAFSI